MRGATLDVQWGNCHVCLEESKLCLCDHSIKVLKSAENGEQRVEADGSFAHAVINMIGMLIGKVFRQVLLHPAFVLLLDISYQIPDVFFC